MDILKISAQSVEADLVHSKVEDGVLDGCEHVGEQGSKKSKSKRLRR